MVKRVVVDDGKINRALYVPEDDKKGVPSQPGYASLEAGRRAALRGLRWLRHNPGRRAPGHIAEKLGLCTMVDDDAPAA